MNIIADENMPFVNELFADIGNVKRVNGRSLTSEQLTGADVLLVRSVTNVNQQLLASNSQIQFVGSATIGTDHLDLAYLTDNNICYANAPGCNATAVGEYAFIAMLELAERYHGNLKNKTVGIIGAGNTGSALDKCLKAYGINVLLCDPPLQAKGDSREFYDLGTLLTQCDVLSLHVPVINTGQYPTRHLFNQKTLESLRLDTWLLNCCRGEVIDNQALIDVKKRRPDLRLVLDVWENEPTPNVELVELVDIATPHIAGYSLEGKARGTFMLYEALCRHLGIASVKTLNHLLTNTLLENHNDNKQFPLVGSKLSSIEIKTLPSQFSLLELCRRVYDLTYDDKTFRKCINIKGGFDQMRKNHTHRREFSVLSLANTGGSKVDWLLNLGFSGVSL